MMLTYTNFHLHLMNFYFSKLVISHSFMNYVSITFRLMTLLVQSGTLQTWDWLNFKRNESWFIPTKLATNLSVSLADSSTRKQGFLVVETNFKMYAYSTSKLHCEILRLFSRVEYQLPNLIVAAITKESLYNAFENGITADQIVSFMQQNAHPRVAQKLPTVPENVTDQIRLWETDLNRVETTLAYFYDDFLSMDVFEAACDLARQRSGLLWEDSEKMRVVVKAEIHQDMKDFLSGQRQ
ncbi:General transcription and DNA repair factor IIH subunit TFB2 [Linum perenne]